MGGPRLLERKTSMLCYKTLGGQFHHGHQLRVGALNALFPFFFSMYPFRASVRQPLYTPYTMDIPPYALRLHILFIGLAQTMSKQIPTKTAFNHSHIGRAEGHESENDGARNARICAVDARCHAPVQHRLHCLSIARGMLVVIYGMAYISRYFSTKPTCAIRAREALYV